MADLPHYDDIRIHIVIDAESPDGTRRVLVDREFAAGDHRKFSASHNEDYVLFAYDNADVPPMSIVRAVEGVTKDVIAAGKKKRGQA